MVSKFIIILGLSIQALATVYVTSPVASTALSAGQPATINWQDDNAAPSLAEFGNAMVSIYVGNARQQTMLQSISTSVNVATTSSLQFTPDASIGPNSDEYFIRFESLDTKDPEAPEFPALAFSAKFTLNNMSGTFNSSIEAQISGQSTAPLAPQATPAPTGATTTGGTASLTNSRAASSTTASRSVSATGASSTQPNGALNVKAGWAGVVLGALVGVFAF